MLATATSVVTGIGLYLPEIEIAVASLALGGSALAVSLVARVKLSGHLAKETRINMESEALT